MNEKNIGTRNFYVYKLWLMTCSQTSFMIWLIPHKVTMLQYMLRSQRHYYELKIILVLNNHKDNLESRQTRVWLAKTNKLVNGTCYDLRDIKLRPPRESLLFQYKKSLIVREILISISYLLLNTLYSTADNRVISTRQFHYSQFTQASL